MTTDQGYDLLQLLFQVAHLDGRILPYAEPENYTEHERETSKHTQYLYQFLKEKPRLKHGLFSRRQHREVLTVVILFNFL